RHQSDGDKDGEPAAKSHADIVTDASSGARLRDEVRRLGQQRGRNIAAALFALRGRSASVQEEPIAASHGACGIWDVTLTVQRADAEWVGRVIGKISRT